ncbi:MAG TPA: sulfite exporter TauE/SafE family protein [Gemmatimonadaceae bacterium]|nr:sulfite exporter TauE/SafE family protein [Gemmatimonadaceae bacterium]
MTLLGAGLALLVGFVLGLLGGGGSVLTVPILIYALHVPVKQAIATSLCVVGLVAFIGFLSHWRQKTVVVRVALAFGPAAVIAAYAGAKIAKHVPPTAQLILFAVVGLAGSALMLRGTFRKSTTTVSDTYEFKLDRRTLVLLSLQGLGVGLLTGLIGVGGGFLIVPALVIVAKLPMRLAIGTSLLVIAMNALSGFAGNIGVVPVDWNLVVWFTGTAAIGSIIGSAISKRAPQRQLKQIFGVLLIGVSLYVLYRR